MPTRLNSKDIRGVLNLGQAALACREVDELRRAALEIMEDLFRCDSANFFLTLSPGGHLDLGRVVSRGITDKNLDRYQKFYYRFDPFLRHFPPPRPVQTLDQLTSTNRLIGSEYYNDFLRPQAIHHILVMTVNSEGRAIGIVALFRPLKSPNFNPTDLVKANLCATYLSGALEKVIFADRAHKRQRAAETLAAGLPCRGVLVADQSLNVIYRNHDAEKLLGASCGETEPRLPSEIARACREVQVPGGEACRRILLELDPRGRPVETAVRLIDQPEEGSLFLISFGPDDAASDWMKKLEEKSISRREMDVAHLILQGLTNTEVASRLYISQHTVENHIKSIFRKLGVKNRTSLIRELVQIPRDGHQWVNVTDPLP